VTALLAIAAPFSLVVIPLLFLIAGLLTPRSLRRKGPGRFARDRLVRLGIPFAVFAVLLWPLLEYALFRWLGTAPDLRTYLRAEGTLDTGVLWFIGALLAFSLVYAGWVRLRGRSAGWRAEIRARHLVGLVLLVAVATFLLRLLVPFEGDNPYVDVNLWEWPGCAAIFGLGIAASRLDWLTAVPDRLGRQSRAAALAGVAALGLLIASADVLNLGEEMWGGWHWAALVFAALESVIVVFGPVWLLGSAQRHLAREIGFARPIVSRSAYGAFLVQGVVLLGLALALRPTPLPAEVKALIVAAGGIVGSFALAWLLISRLPGAMRVL
jgi:heme/copper-type cytochrome/quinol oxidase subunit 4